MPGKGYPITVSIFAQEPIIRPTSIENHNKSPDKKNSEAWLREHVISLFKPEIHHEESIELYEQSKWGKISIFQVCRF